MNPGEFTVPEVARAAGIEYRTLQSWIERGLFTPTIPSVGTGHPARCTKVDAEIVARLARLREIGLSMDGLDRAIREPERLFDDLKACGVAWGFMETSDWVTV